MSKGKLFKFAEVETFPNVFQNFDHDQPHLIDRTKNKINYKGQWSAKHFGNKHPIVLELACGKGDYTLALARECPDKNFIGIDIKGARIWKGAKIALTEKIENAAFIRTRIEYLPIYFDAHEIDEIWITFPDPFPKKSDARKRLTAVKFLDIYKRICKPNAIVHLKTDSHPLFLYSQESITSAGLTIQTVQEDIYSHPDLDPLLKIQTFYEKMHLKEGRQIHYLNFTLPK